MGEGVTINRDTYINLINEDIQALDKYFPEHSLEKRHIKMILEWSIDKEFPEDIWGKRDMCSSPPRLIKEDSPVEPPPDKQSDVSKCNSILPKGFLFNKAGRVVVDPRYIPDLDDEYFLIIKIYTF